MVDPFLGLGQLDELGSATRTAVGVQAEQQLPSQSVGKDFGKAKGYLAEPLGKFFHANVCKCIVLVCKKGEGDCRSS